MNKSYTTNNQKPFAKNDLKEDNSQLESVILKNQKNCSSVSPERFSKDFMFKTITTPLNNQSKIKNIEIEHVNVNDDYYALGNNRITPKMGDNGTRYK